MAETIVLSLEREGEGFIEMLNEYAKYQNLPTTQALRRLLAEVLPLVNRSCEVAKANGKMISVLGTITLS